MAVQIAALEEQMSAQDFWSNREKSSKISEELKSLKKTVEKWKSLKKEAVDLEELLFLAEEEGDEDLLADTVKDLEKFEKKFEHIEIEIMLSEPGDINNAYLNVNSGAGGTEACDWASMLLRMYIRWAERKGFTVELIDDTPGEEAGIKSATIKISGEYAYGYLRSEIGVHRLVRISPFDSNARRHTSFASIFAFPEVDDNIEIEISPADLRIDTYRASGAGGQHVNKTESAIRITHIPSGIVVASQNQRSQHQNKETAMNMLRSKLYNMQLEEREKEKAELEKSKKKIEWGSQIRSYTFQPYTLVKDLRTRYEMGSVQAVMDGDIDEFINEFLKWRMVNC